MKKNDIFFIFCLISLIAAIAAADVARSAKIGVIICARFIPSKGLDSLETTIVLPGSILFLEEKKVLSAIFDCPLDRLQRFSFHQQLLLALLLNLCNQKL